MQKPTKITILAVAALIIASTAFGGGWVIETVDSDGYVGFDSSLVLDSSGYPHISYQETTDWPDNALKYAYFDGARSVYSVDMDGDGDGDTDVLGAAYGGDDITWWENDGSGGGWAEHPVDVDFDGAYSVHSADIDGDGDMDVLGAGLNANDITWWEVTDFDASGDLTSSIYDTEVDTGTLNLEWGPISWTEEVPTNTALELSVRTSNSWSSMGSWTAAANGDDLSNYVDDDTRYFQYKVSMATNDTDASPTFEDITIEWSSVGIDGDEGNLPRTFALYPAAPNPSSGSASIGFALPHTSEVELTLYDIKGRKIETLAEGTHQPGEHFADVKGLSSGVYIYKLNTEGFSDTRKMVVK